MLEKCIVETYLLEHYIKMNIASFYDLLNIDISSRAINTASKTNKSDTTDLIIN